MPRTSIWSERSQGVTFSGYNDKFGRWGTGGVKIVKRNLIVGSIVLMLAAIPARPQAAAGLAEISGTVRDSSGAAIPGAQVVISNTARGIHLSLTTSQGGLFDAPALLPAEGYEVAVDKTGFAQYDVKGIDLAVGQNVYIEAPLAVAGTAATVQVQAIAPLI